MVIVVLTYYLPQHQHPAPGVLEVRSLALLDLSRAVQQILSDGKCLDSWQLTLAPPQPLLGSPNHYPPCHASAIAEELWGEHPQSSALQDQGQMQAAHVRHSAAKRRALGRSKWQAIYSANLTNCKGIFYVPALALQATMHSCTRRKGRKDSDGRVQDAGLRIPECLQTNTDKYNGMRGQ